MAPMSTVRPWRSLESVVAVPPIQTSSTAAFQAAVGGERTCPIGDDPAFEQMTTAWRSGSAITRHGGGRRVFPGAAALPDWRVRIRLTNACGPGYTLETLLSTERTPLTSKRHNQSGHLA